MSKRVKINTTAGVTLCWMTFLATVVGVEMHYGSPTHYWNPLGAIVLGWIGAVMMAALLALISE